MVGVQAFAHATHASNWLIIGGRTDGLHRRQPFASFDKQGNNTLIQVIDPLTLQSWQVSSKELNSSLQDQLSATNMEFTQNGQYLYLLVDMALVVN